MVTPITTLGVRAKLILLFVVIKVVPLLLLAWFAWMGMARLGSQVETHSREMSESVRTTVGSLSEVMTKESVRALDEKSREAIERLTTDTALAVAEFLKGRDSDILLAAALEPSETVYRQFLRHRTRNLVDHGKWVLADDGKSWKAVGVPPAAARVITPDNPENQQNFNYRPPEWIGQQVVRPLYHEITFVGLDGQERFKVSTTGLLPAGLRNVARKENTYARAETYFPALKRLKPGEIYVSDVIGPYVRSNYYGPVIPEAARKIGKAFEPEKEAYAGKENPVGKRFRGIIRWAAPVVQGGQVVGYVTLALDHDHVMRFTDKLMPTEARYTPIPDATNGNYAFMWDYLDRSIAHPRHQSIIGFNPATGDYETPWLEASIYQGWQASGKPLREYLAGVPIFDGQSRDKKPSTELIKAGIRGLDCRYLNFAPQCHGWYDLTKQGGSGSFVILWSGVWKLTTAATIPYYTGQYGKSPRGFGYVTIGANVDEFHKAASDTKLQLDRRVLAYGEQLKEKGEDARRIIGQSLQATTWSLLLSTVIMVGVVIFIAIWLAGLLTRRVTELNHGLGMIEQGDLTHRLAKTSNDEMGRLADSINRMADSVQLSFQRLEEARERAEEANRMKSSFLATMSHELRTPLNGILGFAELLKMELGDEELRSYAEDIYGSGSHLLDIVNDVLDLARIEAGRMELQRVSVDLRELLGDTAAVHRVEAAGKGIELTEQYADDLPETIEADPKRLRQILNNLLNNAVKFTARGSIRLSASMADQRLRIAVSDTGIGIEPELHAKIFEKFTQADHFITRAQGGTGLGLALASELVQLLGGEMGLDSTPGRGSTFYFTLPLGGNTV